MMVRGSGGSLCLEVELLRNLFRASGTYTDGVVRKQEDGNSK